MSSARLRTLLTRARPASRLRVVLASVVAVALATGGILVGAALPAEAHNASTSVSCQALTVSIDSFRPEDGPGKRNTLTITIDGAIAQGWDHAEFGVQPGDGTVVVPFSDPTRQHTWTIDVVAFDDDGTQGWTKHLTGISPVCAAPTVAVSATTCTAVDGNTGVAARLTGLAAADAYRVELFSAGVVKWQRDYAAGQTPAVVDFGSQTAGATYVVRVTDLTIPSLTAEGSVTAASCPQVGGFSAVVEQCTAPGGASQVTLTPSGFVEGHRYTVRTGSVNGSIVGDFVYAAGGTYPVSLTAPATGTSQVVLYAVDEQGGVLSAGPIPVTLEACPTQAVVVSVTPEACVLGATTSDVTVQVSGLTPGRSYQPTLDGVAVGAPVVAPVTQPIVLADVSPGTHSVGLVDTAAPAASATPVSVVVEVCPAVPTIALTPTQCSVPGGDGTLEVTLTGLVTGRSYTATTTSGGKVVDTRAVTTPTWTLSGLAPAAYAVTVQDDADPSATATVPVTMTACPQVGALTVSCSTAGGNATIALGASDLIPGDSYSVLFERQTAAGGYTTVKQVPPTTSLSAADLSLSGVVAGQTYRVTLSNLSNPALSDTLVVPVQENCSSGQVGGVSYTAGGSVSALALTGTDTGRLALIALLLLVPGAGLIGFAILRHRKEVGD